MVPDKLFDLAFEYQKTRLWEKLSAGFLFAVRHGDGLLSYCCAAPQVGGKGALILFLGESGLNAFLRQQISPPDADQEAYLELEVRRSYVACVFEKQEGMPQPMQTALREYLERRGLPREETGPCFYCTRPMHMEWPMQDPQDQGRMEDGLRAALEVSARLKTATLEELGFAWKEGEELNLPLLAWQDGQFSWSRMQFPQLEQEAYEAPEIRDDYTRAILKEASVRGRRARWEWGVDVFLCQTPIEPEDGSAPYYTYGLIIQDMGTEDVLCVDLVQDPGDYAETFLRKFVEKARELGAPRKVWVRGRRTMEMLRSACKRMGSELVLEKGNSALAEAVKRLGGGAFNITDSEKDEMAQMTEMLEDEETCGTLDDVALLTLREFVGSGILSQKAEEHILRECGRRGL